MKRILNVSNFSSIRLKCCYVNDVIRKVSNGLIRNGYEVIQYSDRDMCRFLGFGFMNYIGRRRIQTHFVEFCKKCKPDGIMLSHADVIYPETLVEVKKQLPNVRIMQYNIDAICPSLEQGVGNAERIKSKADVVDVTLVSTGDQKLLKQFKNATNYVGFMPNLVDKSLEIEKMFEHEAAEFDLMFGGTRSKRKFCGQLISLSDLVALITEKVAGVKIKVFGLDRHNMLEGPDYQNVYSKAVMGLNISAINDSYLYSSDRMAHIMGNGLLCVMEGSSGFKDLFSDEEVCFYNTSEELIEKIAYYKNNPEERMRVAKNGHDKYLELFNEKIVTKYMADALFDRLNKDDYIWTKLIDVK